MSGMRRGCGWAGAVSVPAAIVLSEQVGDVLSAGEDGG